MQKDPWLKTHIDMDVPSCALDNHQQKRTIHQQKEFYIVFQKMYPVLKANQKLNTLIL